MEWIDVKAEIPPVDETGMREKPYVLAFHTVHGVGVAWFWQFKDDGIAEQIEEEFGDKYICSCHFIKNVVDGNFCIDDEGDIDIFEHSPHFPNLGTVTHWMPLPASTSKMELYQP